MRFDLPTLSALSVWCNQNLSGATITTVDCSDRVLQVHLDTGHWLRLTYARRPALQISDSAADMGDPMPLQPLTRAAKFLLGAQLLEAQAATRDRYLWLRLQRPDRDGQPTYGRLYLELIVPRFRAVLVSERRGHALGIWQATTDPRPRQTGSTYEPPSSDRLLPGTDSLEDLQADWQAEETIHRYLIRRLAGATRALVWAICEQTGLEPSALASDITHEQWRLLWEAATERYTQQVDRAWSWPASDGQMQVSVVEPPTSSQARQHDDIGMALATNWIPVADDDSRHRDDLQQQLQRQRRRLQHSYQAMQADLVQADEADQCERHGHLLMASAGQILPGASLVELPDPFMGVDAVTRVELDPRQTPVQVATRLLKRAKKLRRRLEVLPARMGQITAQIEGIDDLLQKVEKGVDLTRDEIEALEKGMAERQGSTARPPREDERDGARPRRYRTSSGWTVWAGRNNTENDKLSHRLAAQNDYWFHAHGYAGSHVLLRRDGRKEEPDSRTLEEAAAVAAYWSKGRTARKVPVVYTLAKYVSKPRGAAPGLAVMKRERTIMVQPGLLPEDDAVQ